MEELLKGLQRLHPACQCESTKGKDKTMEQQHESNLVKRLKQLGIEVDVSPAIITLTYEQIYTSVPTLEEALITFLGEALSRYEALRKRSGLTLL
jgi:hypothetical protein